MRAVSALAALVWATATASPVAAQALQPEELFDAAIGDWNRDGRSDLAILVQSDTAERDTSLFIYLREDAEDGVLELVFSAEDMLWDSGGSNRFHGQVPSLEVMPHGSLAITEQNWGAGRERWTSTVTVAWRDERFVAAGYTYSAFDTLQEEEPFNCDLNLLTGRGTIDGRAVTFPAHTIELGEWTGEYGENPGLLICRDER